MATDSELRDLASEQYGLLGRRQAHDLGVLGKAMDHRIRRGEWKRLSPEVLALAGSPESPQRGAMAAVLDSPPGAVLSHGSAAAHWDLPGFRLAAPFHVTVPRQGVGRRNRLAVVHFQKDLPLDHVIWLRGIPVTSPALTVFHLAGTMHPARVERALDNAWAMDILNGDQLETLLGRLAARGRNGIRLMRDLIGARSGGYVPPESGNEARYLILCREAGVPMPRRQIVLGEDFVVGRVDFLFDEVPGVVEVLSRRYHTSKLDREADQRRFELLKEMGLDILTIWDDQLWHRPHEVVEQTRDFLRRLGYSQPFSRATTAL